MEKHVNNPENTVKSEESEAEEAKKKETTEDWDGILEIDPLTVRRIIEANQLVEDLEEAGEL
jgi:hypothetical protein